MFLLKTMQAVEDANKALSLTCILSCFNSQSLQAATISVIVSFLAPVPDMSYCKFYVKASDDGGGASDTTNTKFAAPSDIQ